MLETFVLTRNALQFDIYSLNKDQLATNILSQLLQTLTRNKILNYLNIVQFSKLNSLLITMRQTAHFFFQNAIFIFAFKTGKSFNKHPIVSTDQLSVINKPTYILFNYEKDERKIHLSTLNINCKIPHVIFKILTELDNPFKK